MFSRTVFLVLVILLASIVVWIQVRPHSYLTDFGYLWGNAAQVANPEYQLAFQGDVRREFFALGMDITVDSHSRNNSSEPSERVVEISEDWLGTIAFKRLPEDPMAHYLETFRGGRGSDSQAKARAAEQTEELKSDELATVVVELSEPMSEVYVEEEFGLDLAEWKRFFLSGSRPSPEKPVYCWPGKGGCSATLLIDHQCDNPSAISQFRQWVRRLNDGDQENLAKLDLDLNHLRAAAAQGQVFGFIANTFSRSQILGLLAKPEVRTVRIVEHWVEDEE